MIQKKGVKPAQMDCLYRWSVNWASLNRLTKNRLIRLSWNLNELGNKKRNGKKKWHTQKITNKIVEASKNGMLFKINEKTKTKRKMKK
jgi:hypothetical protein